MFWDWEDSLWDWEDPSDLSRKEWSEYLVMIALTDNPKSPVVLNVWAKSYDDAMTCGEVLSGIYL